MEIIKTNIDGLFQINFVTFNDIRGQLFKPFRYDALSVVGINFIPKEIWFTQSNKNVIRAMHMQITKNMDCSKLVSIVSGAIEDIVIDLRKTSKTFKQVFSVKINENDKVALYIPEGCAHGYKALQEETTVMYASPALHLPEDDIGIKWDSFDYDWKIDKPIISERDKQLPTLNEFLANE